jgi:hypothetical protein
VRCGNQNKMDKTKTDDTRKHIPLDRVHPVRYLFILCNINGAHVNDNFYHLKLGYYPKATCNYYLHKRF